MSVKSDAFCSSFGKLLPLFKFKVGLIIPVLHLTIATKFYVCICYSTGSYTNYYFVYTDRTTSVQDRFFLLPCIYRGKKTLGALVLIRHSQFFNLSMGCPVQVTKDSKVQNLICCAKKLFYKKEKRSLRPSG